MEKNDKNILLYNNEKIEYIILKRKIKNIYISIEKGNVIVKAPVRASYNTIQELLEKKKKWIYRNWIKQQMQEDRSIDLINKNYIYLLGNKIVVEYIYQNIKNIKIEIRNEKCKIYIPINYKDKEDIYSKIQKKLDDEIKNIAKKNIEIAMKKIIDMTGLSPKEVIIRKFKRIWGNCSSKKVIKINQNIIWYSQKEIEYVCLHEICHLKYMNHKKEFWNLISKNMPDYKERIKVLRG